MSQSPSSGKQALYRSQQASSFAMAAVVVGLVATPSAAHAYTIANELATGCHEQITAEALRRVRIELGTAAPLPVTDNEKALVDDLQFNLDRDMHDLGGATFIASVRDNDLKGLSSDDLTALAEVHGDPKGQEEHCLRAADQKEPSGSAAAVSACRAFVRGRAMDAVAGLDAAGMPDLTKRTVLTIHLSVRGQVDAPLPTYYVRIGQAVHAIEDSFTHTYRTPDEMKITVVLNWLDQVNGTLVESRDGPGHSTVLDRCDDADALRKTRHGLAIDAATALLRATLDPQKTPDQKMAAVDTVLDTYLSYFPGCTFGNHWCDAPESAYGNPNGCGCRVGNERGSSRVMLSGIGLALLAIARRARRRRPGAAIVAVLAIAGAILLDPSRALAQAGGKKKAAADPAAPTTTTSTQPGRAATSTTPSVQPTTTTSTTVPATTPGAPGTTETTVVTPSTTTTTVSTPTVGDAHQPPAPTIIPVKEPGPRDATATAFGAYLGASGSVDKAALAGTLGLRLRASKQWTFGLDGEWNPFLSFTGTTVRAGAINLYGSAMLRFPLAYENFNLRTTLSLGTSYLLTTLYGAPSGSVGLYGGVSFLGVEWKLSRVFYLVINPLNIALPVPQIKGVPFLYPQYRFSIGLEVYAG
jgi:MYXO-CTERM domain-containing protein